LRKLPLDSSLSPAYNEEQQAMRGPSTLLYSPQESFWLVERSGDFQGNTSPSTALKAFLPRRPPPVRRIQRLGNM
jgi:hypothetical protein